ncbi:MAG: hypothetical protein R3Y56_06040 [Akkermansia sp.]
MNAITTLTTCALLACACCTAAPAQHPQAASVKNANAEWGRTLASRLRAIQQADIDSICIAYSYTPYIEGKGHQFNKQIEKEISLSEEDSAQVRKLLQEHLKLPQHPVVAPKFRMSPKALTYRVTLIAKKQGEVVFNIDTRDLFPHKDYELQIKREAQYQIHAIMMSYLDEAKLKLPADYLRTTPCTNC